MFRRANGRPPPFLIGGLVIIILILSFSYWTLNTQNNDTLKSLEKMQANLKIGELKTDQSERKMSALQDLLHDKEETAKQQEHRLLQQEEDIKTFNNDLKKRDYQITSLKNDIDKFHEKLKLLEDKNTECEGDNEKILKENDLVLTQRDDAVNALNKRDEQINELSRKLEQERQHNRQLDANMSELRRQLTQAQLSNSKWEASERERLNGVALEKQSSHPPTKPDHNAQAPAVAGNNMGHVDDTKNGAGAAVVPKPESAGQALGVQVGEEQNLGVLPQPLGMGPEGAGQHLRHDDGDTGADRHNQQLQQNVLQPPPDFSDNLDAAIDEGNRLADDPLLPDQDPAGGDMAGQENALRDDRVHENRVHEDMDHHHEDTRHANNKDPGHLNGFGDGAEGGEDIDGVGNNRDNQEFIDERGNVIEEDNNNNVLLNGMIRNTNIRKENNGNEPEDQEDIDAGGGAIDSPLQNNNNNNNIKDNHGGEVEAGANNGEGEGAPLEEDAADNRAKENFFGEDPPLRLAGIDRNSGPGSKGVLKDNMLLH